MINWDKLTKNEVKAISRICRRACKKFPALNFTALDMDISAAHINEPLDLLKFENFTDIDFTHDVFGISRHIDRATGSLTRCFVPRCSA